jgi:hypothetical protein
LSFIGDIVGGLLGAHASKKAANVQADMFTKGIDEERRQYDTTRSDLLPWLTAGQSALGGLQDILGLSGADKQQAAIAGIENSPQFASLNRQGEQAILQNASATGGLRGGNVQSSLYNNRADLLAQLIDQQYSRLGALSGAGAQTGANIGGFGQNAANAIAGLFGNIGQAKAGGILGAASGYTKAIQGVGNLLSSVIGF